MKCRKDLLGVTALRDKQSLRYVRSRKVELKFAKTKLSKGGKRTVRFVRYLFALKNHHQSGCLAEWLRRRTWNQSCNPLGNSFVGSNPAAVAVPFYFSVYYFSKNRKPKSSTTKILMLFRFPDYGQIFSGPPVYDTGCSAKAIDLWRSCVIQFRLLPPSYWSLFSRAGSSTFILRGDTKLFYCPKFSGAKTFFISDQNCVRCVVFIECLILIDFYWDEFKLVHKFAW